MTVHLSEIHDFDADDLLRRLPPPLKRPFWWCRLFHRRQWAFGISTGGSDPHDYYYCGLCAREIR